MIDPSALAEARVRGGLSQRKLAALAGLNFQVIRRLEAGGDDGNLTLREFAGICQALFVPPRQLLQHIPLAAAQAAAPRPEASELDVAQARLLRRIQRGEDLRRRLSIEDRTLVLPTLVKQHLVRTHNGQLLLTTTAAAALPDPESL